MRKVFADTFYWAASINVGDDWHDRVLEVTATLDRTSIITTEEVLAEVLTFFQPVGVE